MSEYVVKKIHEASMRILERTGLKFIHPDAQKILREHGIDVDEEGVARFTEEQLMYWVHKAPSHVKIYAPDPAYSVDLGGDRTELAPCTGCAVISDREGKQRPSTMEDFVNYIKLFEVNPQYRVSGHCIITPNDIPAEHMYPLMHYAAYTHSNKSLLIGMGTYKDCEDMIQMLLAQYGGDEEKLRAYPNAMTIVNVDAPLRLDIKMTETLISFARHGLPVMCACCDMAGSTAPVTLAGTIAQTNCELLAAIALIQMINPGNPCMYGSVSTTADLRTGGIAMGAPEAALCFKYAAELGKYYGLPVRGGGALTDAKVVDVQAGYESMLNMFASKQSKINLILHGAGILDGFASTSYEKLITDFEMNDYIDRYLRDVCVEEDRIPEDLMDEVGHEGGYLIEDHTFEYCRIDPYTPSISVRGRTEDPAGQLHTNIQAKLKKMFAAYQKPERDEIILANMRKVLIDRGVDPAIIAQIDSL